MRSQFDLIHGENWGTLIILDACRYDIFKQLNRIPGKLEEVLSPAHHTWPWLQRTFPDKYDWTYFSAHPYVNTVQTGQKWNAINHFSSIIPIWRFAWSDKLGTVHPISVCSTVKNIPYEKAMVHFIQPHGPWIGVTKWLNPWTLVDYTRTQLMGDWKAIVTKPDPTFFRRCYKDNLRLVLRNITNYLPYFKKPIVITADHGELLGEKGMYLHGAVEKSKEHLPYPEWALEFLKHVPWFVVDG